MKTFIVCSFILSGLLTRADEVPAFGFPRSKIEAPPLSLIDNAKQGLPPVFGDGSVYHRGPEHRLTPPRRLVSRMPIIVPPRSVDVHMPVKTPDESIDYKMLVNAPDMESVK